MRAGLIIGFLVAVTLIFEIAKHRVEHSVKHPPAESIVQVRLIAAPDAPRLTEAQAVWGELTVLGFIAVVVFLISHHGVTSISKAIYGDGPENEMKLGENLEVNL